MKTVDALKALYAALGGSADTVADMVLIPDVISAIATLVSSGLPGALPAVTAEDNGDVLTVVEGAWAAAAPAAPATASET